MERLILENNLLSGTIPFALTVNMNFHTISLENNMLVGQIPETLGSLHNLKILSLAHNQLTGKIPPSIANIHLLTRLHLNNNNLSGVIPIELNRITGLVTLHLQFNQFQGTIPSSLCNFPSLIHLHLGNNLLVGTLPNDLGENLPCLVELNLENNRLEGTIPSSISSAFNLQLLNLQSNRFTGYVPLNLGNMNLSTLLLANNQLDGWGFVDSLSNCSFLERIDLSNNHLSGPLPDSIGNLSPKLKTFMIRANRITGPIPSSLRHLTNLETFEVTENYLSGSIPSFFGSFSKLSTLSLGGNDLSGKIPTSLGSLSGLIGLDLSGNMLSGVLPTEIGMLKNLHVLDLSYNNISGPLPTSLGECQSLISLHLQWNKFNGTIPNSISHLSVITTLDLSHNQFSGQIPSYFESLGSLQFLNLSFNSLEGEVPAKGIFDVPTHFSITGNKKLCGGNPNLQLKKCSKTDRTHLSTAVRIMISASIAIILLSFVCFISRKCLRGWQRDDTSRQIVEYELTRFENVPYVQLHKATNGFSQSNLIGTGGFASVYKGCFGQERTEAAVKVFRQELDGYISNFMAECEVLSSFHHNNLVKVLTACSSRDSSGREFKALVYEYMPNGSLEQWLHGGMQHQEGSSNFTVHTLNILQRIDILIDVAVALSYLHNEVAPPIAHLDVKPGNILLRDNMTACLGDFGLTRILSPSTSHEVKGTFGYLAPESLMGEPACTQWDVYSFGIVLLEVFTGKKPTDGLFVNGLHLRKHVLMNYPDSIKMVLDPHLMEEVLDGELMEKIITDYIIVMIKVGLDCSKQNPDERLKMTDIVKVLKAVRADYLKIQWTPEIS